MEQKQTKRDLIRELIKAFQISGDHYMESISFLLRIRKEKMDDINHNLKEINTLTCCAIVMFFSYVENTTKFIKRILAKGIDSGIVTTDSRKHHQLVYKDEDKLTFEDMMKLTFSVCPSLFGAGNRYGDIKNRDLKTLFIMRDIRHTIIHPKGIEDMFVTLRQLDGKDIDLPMIAYINALKNLINICAEKI